MPEITIAAASVSIQASAILRTVESCNPEPLAAMVPAMPEDNTWVVETGNPYASAAAIVAAAVISAPAPCVGQMRLADFLTDRDDDAFPADHCS